MYSALKQIYFFLLLFCSILLYSCQPDTSGYSCVNGNCIPITDSADFPSLDACLGGCDSIGYNCIGGVCTEVPKANATYRYFRDCEAACQ